MKKIKNLKSQNEVSTKLTVLNFYSVSQINIKNTIRYEYDGNTKREHKIIMAKINYEFFKLIAQFKSLRVKKVAKCEKYSLTL